MTALIGTLVNRPAAALVYTGTSRLVLPDTYVGVEVEAENVPRSFMDRPPPDIKTHWHPHIDDSLRDNGMEFAFAQPLFGMDVINAIVTLCEVARKHDFKTSMRTGLHVHIDVRELNLDQFIRLQVLYALVEAPIFRWVGDGRDKNHFCLPWYVAQGDLRKAASAFMAPPPECQKILERVHRYSACNLQAVAKFGSLEFRHLKTCFDSSRIIQWINILLSLKKAAVNSIIPPEALCEYSLNIGARQFLNEVFGPIATELWYPDYYKDIYEFGALSAEEIIRAVTPKSTSPAIADAMWRTMLYQQMEDEGDSAGYTRLISKLANKAKISAAIDIQPADPIDAGPIDMFEQLPPIQEEEDLF